MFVPYQRIEQLWLDEAEHPGVTELSRQRLMEGRGVGLEEENEITLAANSHAKSIGGVKKIQQSERLSYIAACNHLYRAVYYDADQLDNTVTTIQPAPLTATVLDRFNGVLEPERHIDGAINLTGELPVKGIGKQDGSFTGSATVRESDGQEVTYESARHIQGGTSYSTFRVEEDPDNPGFPHIRVELDGSTEFTLRDMVKSQKIDALVRDFAKIVKTDPQHGEEAVERALYGIKVDFDDNCQVLYRQMHELSAQHQRPTDGPSINEVSGHFELSTRFATLVPVSELGGQLVTICMVKPLETISKQPDPAQTEEWALVNVIHDQTELDEQLLSRRDLETDIEAADEDQPVFWVGHNSLKHNYSTQGPNDQQTYDVQLKSSMWLYEVPSSVTPSNVTYPADGITMYPFFNWNGPHAEYTVSQVAAISTSLAKGPNPVERISLFESDPTLVNDDT